MTSQTTGEQTALVQSALDALPVGLIVHDRNGQIAVHNTVASALTGDYQADALLRSATETVIARAAKGNWEPELLDLHDPTPKTFRISSKPLVDGANVVIIEDVSERRHLDAVRRDFVANVSHELRTPIGAIGLLIETLAGETDPKAISMLQDHIADEARRAKRLVDELLTLGRLEAESTAPLKFVHISDVVDSAVVRVSPVATERSIKIHINVEHEDLVVNGDSEALLSALVNLLENAVKYSDNKTTITVIISRDGNECAVSISDEGIGIPARDLHRVFERFYRVDQARSRDTGGAGLGLAIVRHVAENHGGRVAVHSREGEGSVFKLSLPLS